jgi:uncharacterized membrane protein
MDFPDQLFPTAWALPVLGALGFSLRRAPWGRLRVTAQFNVLTIGALAVLLLLAAGVYAAGYLLNEYRPDFLLLAFPEAWISGMAITLMVVYRPAWVATFDDSRYLLNK